MRRTAILTLCALACALMVCALSLGAVNATADEALRLHALTLEAAERDDVPGALSLLDELERHWRGRATLMEIMASHDALHDVSASLAEAQICLTCNDRDDFLRAMSAVRMGLEHLKDEEAVKWANLY